MNMVISANKARQRLLRLSEAAEKLRRQAAISVQTGKEDDARDLLLQKKKTMQALEKTKSRIELLDELSTKLYEAISLRERQLVGTVALDLDIEKEDTESQVRVVSPPSETLGDDEYSKSKNDLIDTTNDPELQNGTYDMLEGHKINNLEGSLQVPLRHVVDDNDDIIGNLTGLTSYEDFLDRVDQRLNTVEDELITIVKFSTLVLESKEKSTNLKVQQLTEILDAVQHIRERIGVIRQTKSDDIMV
ncbi:uncharacterized protein [Rutidosis leptorrhynchoides]|uniref:uncharacterized protein isoform X2 n=1 Tax=Rutidosis leptorrhynchoides TaxID=125765 RepID=UPI003A9A374A